MASSADTSMPTADWRAWSRFALVSIIFFHITAATFTSLGVALPFMIEELAWSWANAGLGFSVLAFMVGISGRLPAWVMQRFGIGASFGLGGLAMVIGFGLLAVAEALPMYFAGAACAGLGYTLCAPVPGVAVLNRSFPRRRSFAIGAYMTIGGLGGVAGPLIVTTVVGLTGTWRAHWWLLAGSIALLAAIALFMFRGEKESRANYDQAQVTAGPKKRVFVTTHDWELKDVIKTPQYFVIVVAYTVTLFVGLTTNSWAVTHMGTLGVAITVAAAAMSAQALVNALSRAFGGALASWIDPKWLLASALLAGIIGMTALASADNPFAIALFSFGEGYSFGMCLFATTILLVNYFGPREAPKTLGTMHVITTIGMVGPVLGGLFADWFGGFAGLFRVYALILFGCLVATLLMKPPRPPELERSHRKQAED